MRQQVINAMINENVIIYAIVTCSLYYYIL